MIVRVLSSTLQFSLKSDFNKIHFTFLFLRIDFFRAIDHNANCMVRIPQGMHHTEC